VSLPSPLRQSFIDLSCWLSSLAYAAQFKRVGRKYFFHVLLALVDSDGARVVPFAADRMPSHVGLVETVRDGATAPGA
jgi:hypothetical protein